MKILQINKIKIIGLGLFVLLLIGGLSLLTIFLVREHHRTVNLEKAVKVFESGDYTLARKLFYQVITNDPNQEQAYVCLAKIARSEGNWQREAHYWHIAQRLNALMPEYRENRKAALARERNFDGLLTQSFFRMTQDKVMSDEDSFLFLLASRRSNFTRDRDSYWKLLEAKNPDFFHKEPGRLLRILTASEISPEMEKDLAGLEKSRNPVIAFEALLQRAEIQRKTLDGASKVEQTLINAVKVNPFCGRPLLLDFYIRTYQFNRAIEIGEEDWKLFRRPITALNLGDLYLLTGSSDRLADMQKNFMQGGKSEMLVGFYLESLQRLAANNPEALIKSWEQTGNNFHSPVALFTSLYYAVAKDDLKLVENTWMKIQHAQSFYDLPQRAEKILFGYVHGLLAKERFEDALKLLSMYQVRKFQDLSLARCYILGKFTKRTLQEYDLSNALAAFPDDLILLQCAVEYYYHTGDINRAMAHVEHALKQNPPEDSGIHYFRIFCLVRLGRNDEAANLFQAAVSLRKNDLSLLASYCEFCVENHRRDDLEKLLTLMRSEASDSGRNNLVPYVEGEIFLMQGRIPEALDCFEKTRTGQSKILFRMADRLGTHDRFEPAIQNYRLLLSDEKAASYRPYVLANLSELYYATNRKGEALELAEQAWKLAPENRDIQQCLAHQLLAVKASGKALKVIADGGYNEKLPMELKKLWIAAAEMEIPELFAGHRRLDAERLCKELLHYDSESSLAKEYLRKINPPAEDAK